MMPFSSPPDPTLLHSTSLSPYAATPLFGNGSDGDVTITTAVSLARTMNYRNLTISGAGKLNLTSFQLFVSGTLDISNAGAGAINLNGQAGQGVAASTGGAAAGVPSFRSIPPSLAGGLGATGGLAAGAAGGLPGAQSWIQGGLSGNSGAGGANGAAVAGGNGGTVSAAINIQWQYITPNTGPFLITNSANIGAITNSPGSGSPGAGAGAGDGTNAGGGGGGGGSSGGWLNIFARFIQRGTNVTVGIIQSIGGNGGVGGNAAGGTAGGGGGAAGAGGGFIYIVTEGLLGSTIVNALDASGGNGGRGGVGAGTGKGGAGGDGGRSGNIQVICLSASSYSVLSGNVAGTTGTVSGTSAGGVGGLGTLQQGNL